MCAAVLLCDTGAPELTRWAVERGLVVALGHHMADSADIAACAEAGASLLTHLGNGVATQLNRHENPVISGLAQDLLSASLITDGELMAKISHSSQDSASDHLA